MTAHLDYALRPTTTPVPAARRAEILADGTFGRHFTDHMATATWTEERGWHDGVLEPYGPLLLDPAAAALHFGQEVFEGLRAIRRADDSIAIFRPDMNAERFRRSCRRLALPELEVDDFLAALDVVVRADRDWVPSGAGTSLYLRPFMFASEAFLHVRAARRVTFVVIAAPATSYFGGPPRPLSIWISRDYTRAAAGGTGAAKCGGNYAASLVAQREAADNGCDQVLFLDAVHRRWVEEIGNMNLFVVEADGRIATPDLSGTILAGVTRDSIMTLAADLGHLVEVRPLVLDDLLEGLAEGRITEVFACGTAAAVAPIGRLRWRGGEVRVGDGTAGPVASGLGRALLDVQHGRTPDRHGWLRQVC